MSKSSDNHSIFSYGTLMFPAVMEILLGQCFVGRPVIARGFTRHPVIGQVYPGILAASEYHRLEGVLWSGLSSRHLSILDEFEDDFYSAELLCLAGTEARIYVVPADKADILDVSSSWSPEDFKSHHYEEYLKQVRSWRETQKSF